jgi:hypothetical protein
VYGYIYLPDTGKAKDSLAIAAVKGESGDTITIKDKDIVPCRGPNVVFYSRPLHPGAYQTTLSGRHIKSMSASVNVAKDQAIEQDFSPDAPETPNPLLVLVPIAFLVSIWLIRWNNLAVASRLGLLASVTDMKLRLSMSPTSSQGLRAAEVSRLEADLKKKSVWDWLFWSRGLEIAGWMLIHKLEISLLESASSARVDARLHSAAQQLAGIDSAAAKGLGARISAAFEGPNSPPDRKQLLVEALTFLYDCKDTGFASLTSWQNKAFWLTLVGVIFVASLSATEGHANLFLAGAAGGFLSRIMRQIKRADVPNDYGASWATLFLSPIAGALAGWFGVVLIMLLADPNVGVLSGPLKAIDWNAANVAPVLGAAFVLGFSERLFDGLVTQLEDTIDQKKEAAQKAQANVPPVAPAGGNSAADLQNLSAGQTVTIALPDTDLTKVKSADLFNTATKQERTADNVTVAKDSLTFALPADIDKGTYNLLLVTDSARVDTKKQLTITTSK